MSSESLPAVNSTSIMKPPGGECHDIFGADFLGTPHHHRVLKPPGGGTSDLFATPVEDKSKLTSTDSIESTKSVMQNGLDAAMRSGNVSMSSLSLDDSDADADSVPSSVLSNEIRNLTAQLETRTQKQMLQSRRQRNGNPVTGEGYDTQDSRPSAAPQIRTRIPPGGYSSGLW